MRTVSALATLAVLASTLSLTACNVLGGCGGFTGGGDQVMQRSGGTDVIILCDNGGFVATLDSTDVGGFAQWDDTLLATRGQVGGTDQVLFTLHTDQTTGLASAPELGTDTWIPVTLDQIDLDHANVKCERLESETWWSAGPQQ